MTPDKSETLLVAASASERTSGSVGLPVAHVPSTFSSLVSSSVFIRVDPWLNKNSPVDSALRART